MALYYYEPALRDVYVEGRRDVGLIGWYLREHLIEDVAVFGIDDRVEIPSEQVRTLVNLDVNARGRAIYLAHHCTQELGGSQLGVTVIVDADFSRLQVLKPTYDCLFYTDHPAMECYVLADNPLEKLLRVALHQPAEVTAAGVREALRPALQDIFAVRYVLHESQIGCIDDIAAVCTLEEGHGEADMGELLRRSLSQTRKQDWPASLQELTAKAAAVRQRVHDADQHGRGHDIAPLLIALLRLKGPAANRDGLEMTMRSCLSLDDLNATALFPALRARLASA